jgi:hypothetical protein
MLRLAMLSLAGSVALCACGTYHAASPAASAGPVVQTPAGAYALGTGVIESVALLPAPLLGERASASTGGSIPPHAGYRLSIRMQDGSLQVIDQPSRDFQVGDRVRVMGSGRVVRM